MDMVPRFYVIDVESDQSEVVGEDQIDQTDNRDESCRVSLAPTEDEMYRRYDSTN